MTQEEKQLLVKDLSARILYDPIINVGENNHPFKLSQRLRWILEYGNVKSIEDLLDNIKPYLRPMSSMTKNEGKELEHIFCEIGASCWVDIEYGCVNFASGNDFIDTEIAEVYIDWLNKKMFDYRGLIEKGLALEAPEGMYKIE